ncbi:rhythmically expressed gene 5 protein [Parasteatoda tepidariorum]|uniref:rhythmically expressed gene 5 protein n=1 Tax=Parasteatoda tepidariorum TaxID=114398 RepID=UPI00077F8C1D|nr:rhythmically expressed gene 5 protein [Parasteatoda tepidariorum]
MNLYVPLAVLFLILTKSVSPSAIPMWEMLSYEEKMGRLMYQFVHLVERYCKTSSAPDCRKIMSLHGISNLLNYDENTLDLLDPDQREGQKLVWQAATKSEYKYPFEKNQDTIKESSDQEPSFSETNDDYPQRVVVPAPKYLLRRWGRF